MSSHNPQIKLRDMSTLFVECKTFIEYFIEQEKLEAQLLPDYAKPRMVGIGLICCDKCHENDRNKIYVRPFREGALGEVGNTDWNLCIEGIICCALYDKVRAIPRDWWVQKAREAGVERDDDKGYIYSDSPSHNTNRRRVASRISKKLELEKEDETEGLNSWLKNR